MRLRAWMNDLALGIRLTVGSGRTLRAGLVRLSLGTVGVGLAVMVLLVAASVGEARQAREDRASGRLLVEEPRPGADPLFVWHRNTEFHGATIHRQYVRSGGPNAPLPPGVDRVPAPGESFVSPALADLLASPDAELLRPRLPEKVVGEIGIPGMTMPTDLVAVIGAPSSYQNGSAVYGYGGQNVPALLPTDLVVVLALGLVTLLTPVFIFIATSSRVAGAERDRRLAALRLVGADSRQVRRIAAAESLVSAACGLVLGGGLFLTVRAMAAGVEIAQESFFPEDLTPSWPLVVLIVVAVPVLAVLATQFALRRTIIEPLTVVRYAKPVRRRFWWRAVPGLAGVALLVTLDRSYPDTAQLGVGAVLVLISGPVLVPWLVERVVFMFKGSGTPSFQLAARRLQLDSGTPARVVAGVGVVLAGAIALQLVLAGQESRYDWETASPYDGYSSLETDEATAPAAIAAMRAVPGVEQHSVVRSLTLAKDGRYTQVTVADCTTVMKLLAVDRCRDGDAFKQEPALRSVIQPGATVDVVDGSSRPSARVATIQVPANIQQATVDPRNHSIVGEYVFTPAAVSSRAVLPMIVRGTFRADVGDPDTIERMRNAVDVFATNVRLSAYTAVSYSGHAEMFLDIRRGLLAGSVLTLSLAALSLLVMAVEQTRERRRSIAALSATGVATTTLARSLLWQNAIPMLLAVTTATATGVTLAAVVSWLMRVPFTMDWTTIAVLTSATAVLVFLITALALPTLRSATRLTALRSE